MVPLEYLFRKKFAPPTLFEWISSTFCGVFSLIRPHSSSELQGAGGTTPPTPNHLCCRVSQRISLVLLHITEDQITDNACAEPTRPDWLFCGQPGKNLGCSLYEPVLIPICKQTINGFEGHFVTLFKKTS